MVNKRGLAIDDGDGPNIWIWISNTLVLPHWGLVVYKRIHGYIIDHSNPTVRITTWLLTPLMLYVLILSINFATHTLKTTLNDRFFWKTFHRNFYLLSRVLARNLLRWNRQRNIFHISIWSRCCLAWGLSHGLTSNKPTQYVLNYGTDHAKVYLKIQTRATRTEINLPGLDYVLLEAYNL